MTPSASGPLDGDVAVVGAGPAGTAAAITLARLGRQVVLVDKAAFPRDKCCGDGLTTAALRLLEELGLTPPMVPSWEPVEEAIVVVPDGRRVRFPLPVEPGSSAQFAASARRTDLDAALVRLAAQAGALVIEGHRVTGVNPLAGFQGVQLDLDEGPPVRARYVVAADGMWSAVRRALDLGQPGYLGDWQAGRQYYAGVGPEARKLWVWFEPDMAPGYAWSFPLPDGTANVGYGVLRRPGLPVTELRGQRVEMLSRPHIAEILGAGATPVEPWKAWPIPARIGRTALTGLGGRVLFVGDAARACDPMTGEGIAQAMETAQLAARAIQLAGPHRPAAAAVRYERQIRWGLALDDRLALDLSRVLEHARGANGAMSIADSGAWFRRQFARWMFEDYPRAVLVTPHRWRRDLFRRPGAFAA
jgi:geranylgeranyl reductase family protein